MEGVSVRRVAMGDLAAIADVHIAAFPDAAITRLGREAVRRYYAWQCEPVHDAVGLVAVRDARIVGYCFGGVFQGAVSGYLRANLMFLAGAVLRRPAVLAGPDFRARVGRGLDLLRRTWRSPVQAAPADPKPGAGSATRAFGILVIATDPRAQRAGVGRALMAEAEAEARRVGFPRMRLSVHPGNAGAVRFYETLGWSRVPNGPAWTGGMERALDAPHVGHSPDA